ncbi:MAG: tRNA glutamyl-Q(34) synthetase GluQRS [Rhizobiaceae bacterium]|nr:tRNA glutamyl-Q(34) synthetase GluQRS [Rhizobiaceae bacterium]
MVTTTFRFAPSPNGELHLGHAYSALLNASLARRRGGRFLLRIEDIDTIRCTPAFEAGIISDLEWLGLRWEEPVRRQSEHFDAYRAALKRLIDGGLVYAAFMSRGEVRAYIERTTGGETAWPRDPDGAPHYPPVDRSLSVGERRRRIEAGHPFAWRLDMASAVAAAGTGLSWCEFADETLGGSQETAADPAAWGDVVIGRRELPTSYHLSVVVDDALQAVTHVVRGRDLHAATSVHRLLQRLLGLPAPSYFHHRLVVDADGRKLSKSLGGTGLRALREGGATPSDIRAMVGIREAISPSALSRP